MVIHTETIPRGSIITTHSGKEWKVDDYERIRDMIIKKLRRYITYPCYGRTYCFSESYQQEMRLMMDHWKRVNDYCDRNNVDYDQMEERYGPAFTENDGDDPWAYSKVFERIYGAPLHDFTGKYPIAISE